MIENVSEASWNSLVHTPLLEIAIEPPAETDDDENDVDVDDDAVADQDDPVSFWDITAARPHRSFLPKDARGEALEAKMVDFCLAVSDTDIQAAAVRTVKACQANAGPSDSNLVRSINHTEYMPLRWRPIAVNIETKTPDGSSQEGMAQLSVWAATHFERLRALKRSKGALLREMQTDEALSTALPLLLIQGSTWSLFFAVDGTDRIDIFNGIVIGDTTTMIGCYKVVAALRELATWSETTFRTWLLDEVLV
ncbi:hypothetical protein CDV36_014357 [Fusarium kuroshium]|uniref:PD-(D/E)XK nuclease-like domain-containing protein n=1 Tax=Fusarium kuroshium TaxID=2010991 RepID=A0A3M2RI23_9HYPO|nr:hypothetical protein CDV36_014357 [Fusarium kuroshium]